MAIIENCWKHVSPGQGAGIDVDDFDNQPHLALKGDEIAHREPLK